MYSTNDLLLRSYDGELTQSELEILEKALLTDGELQLEKIELDEMRKQLANYQPAFSTKFSQNIADKIYTKSKQFDLTPFFKAIVLSGAAAILIILLSIYFTDGSLDLDAIYGLSHYAADEELFTYIN